MKNQDKNKDKDKDKDQISSQVYLGWIGSLIVLIVIMYFFPIGGSPLYEEGKKTLEDFEEEYKRTNPGVSERPF